MSDHETRITTLVQARKEIEDSLLVMATLETRQSNLLREQSEYLASHETRLQQQEERSRAVDERIEKLVSATGEWIRRQRPQREVAKLKLSATGRPRRAASLSPAQRSVIKKLNPAELDQDPGVQRRAAKATESVDFIPEKSRLP